MSAGPCIAVVDDEEPVRNMLRRMLRLDGFEVAPFASGETFLASLRARLPACVILDVHMPELSGLEVQAQLRAAGARIPAIFITASDDPALERTVLEARGVALLRKPFSGEAMLGAVHHALGRGA